MIDDVEFESMAIESQQIMEIIPHRYPFLLIDRVIHIVKDKSAIGIKNVTINEPFFEGHFPNHPIMPGVLIIEAMAQTSAILVAKTTETKSDKALYFMTIDRTKFRKPIGPGDQIHLHVTKTQNRGNVWKFKGQALVNENIMAEANYSAMIMDS